MGSPLLERIRLAIGGFILALAVIAGLFMGHHLSPVGFTVSVLVLAGVAAILLVRFLQRFRDLDPLQPPDERTIQRRLRTSKIMLAILLACFFLALCKILNNPGRIQPLWVATAFAALCIVGSIKNLRRAQADLKQFEDRRTP